MMNNVIVVGANKYFKMTLENGDAVDLIKSDMAFIESIKKGLLIATLCWGALTDNGTFTMVALSGVGEGIVIDIQADLKEKIEKDLDVRQDDILYLAYKIFAHSEMVEDEEEMRTVLTEFIVPLFIINPVAKKAVVLDNKMEEFWNESE